MSDQNVGEHATVPADGGGATTATAPVKKPAPPKRKPKKLPPYKVLLHNDDANTFEHVIRSVVRLTPLAEEEAIIRAIEAHEQDVALLLVTDDRPATRRLGIDIDSRLSSQDRGQISS